MELAEDNDRSQMDVDDNFLNATAEARLAMQEGLGESEIGKLNHIKE